MRSGSDEDEEEPKIYIKTIVLGDFGVGKSTLLVRLLQGEFSQHYTRFIVDFRRMKVWYNKTRFWLTLHDTGGMERFRVIVNNYYGHSKAVLIVFDINEENTLDNARHWLEQFSRHCNSDGPKLLLANKCDLLHAEELEKTLLLFGPKIEALKQDFNCEFFAVSCKKDINIDIALDYLLKEVYEKFVSKRNTQWADINLGDSGQKKPSRCF